VIEKGSWEVLPIFPFLQKKGNVAEDEMYRVFNMGIGMVVVVSADHADQIASELRASGETVYGIGEIAEGNKKVVLR
jgi:phosphoribosylformylglycinamidine cyclo-ligase